MADPSADDALRAAHSKLKGVRLVGVISCMGKRFDARVGPALVKMMHGPDAASPGPPRPPSAASAVRLPQKT